MRSIIFLAILTASSVVHAVPSDPGGVLNLNELELLLQHSSQAKRYWGIEKLIGLPKDYRWLMVEALESPFEDVQIGGINALAVIGDRESAAILTNQLSKVENNPQLKIAVSEALSRMGDHESLPLLRNLLATDDDEYVQEYVSRSIRRLESPGIYYPLLEWKRESVQFNFLIDDVDSISFNTYLQQENLHFSFPRSEWEQIFASMRDSEIVHPCSVGLGQAMVIALSDGRKVKLYMDKHQFYYMNDSYYFHPQNYRIIFRCVKLAEFLEARLRKVERQESQQSN